jgi:hypothetical protein
MKPRKKKAANNEENRTDPSLRRSKSV